MKTLTILSPGLALIIMFMGVKLDCLSHEARVKGFVYLQEIDPTIVVSIRYATAENFLGRPVKGYSKNAAIITKVTAEALKNVQADVQKNGYSLVVYDAYRPQQASDDFVAWSSTPESSKKTIYYPRVEKSKLFELGYVGKKSGHNRGSTIDVTLIKNSSKLIPPLYQQRKLSDGFECTYVEDGTVDMGSSFDLFDSASHGKSGLVLQENKKLRDYLASVMTKHGFKSYAYEWWHFTLANEPHPDEYFNFDIS